MSTEAKNRPVVVIPTYNERGNVIRLLEEICALPEKYDVIIVDDSSPDGTGQAVTSFQESHPNVTLLSRGGKNGIGSAHLDGLRKAYRAGYGVAVTMDCDFTHPPRYIPDLVDALKNCDVVLGSRYLNKDSMSDWSAFRRLMNSISHFLTRFILGLPFDATNAYRCYRISPSTMRQLESVVDHGYGFFFESLYRLQRSQARIKEIPIHLENRAHGSSKMTVAEIKRWFLCLWRVRLATKKDVRSEASSNGKAA